VAAAGLAPEAAAAGAALVYAAAYVGAVSLTLYLYMLRAGNIASYGNPLGVPREEIGNPYRKFQQQNEDEELPPQLEPESPPDIVNVPEPAPSPRPKEERKRAPRWGRIYVTYTKYNPTTDRYYSGRTSAIVDLNNPFHELQARAAVAARDLHHHVDERPEAVGAFLPAEVDRYSLGTAVNYRDRYKDVGYLAIRGREQQLIDSSGINYLRDAKHGRQGELFRFRGGAQSDTRPAITENRIRGVGRANRYGELFHEASNVAFGRLAPYTGFVIQ